MKGRSYLASHLDFDMIGVDHIISTSKVEKEEVANASFISRLNEEEADMLSLVLGREVFASSEKFFSLEKNDVLYIAQIRRIVGAFKVDFVKLEVLA